jgi:hypothetical protein
MKMIRQNLLAYWRIDVMAIALFITLSISAFVAQFLPLLRARQTYTALAADLSAKQQKLTELKETLRLTHARRIVFQANLTDSNFILEPASHLNQRILELTELAAEQGLILDGIEPRRGVISARYETIPIRLTGRGDYRSCTQYLKSLHTRLQDSGIVRIELSSSPGVHNAAIAGFAFELVWYTTPTGVSDIK